MINESFEFSYCKLNINKILTEFIDFIKDKTF